MTATVAGQFPVHDALGSVIGAVGTNGAMAYQYTYDPFGGFTATGTAPTGYGFVYAMAGIEYDPTGLYHANARYFSPSLARFISEDPERGKANMYAYAGNNAVSGSDVSGMEPTWLGVLQGTSTMGATGGGSGGDEGSLQFVPNPFFFILGALIDDSPAQVVNYHRKWTRANFLLATRTTGIDGATVLDSGGGGMLHVSMTPKPAPLGPPPVPVPGGDPNNGWQWNKDPNNSRGGTWGPKVPIPGQSQPSASWDPDGHWDVDNGKKQRFRYDENGRSLTPDEAHGRGGPSGSGSGSQFQIAPPPAWLWLIPIIPFPGNPAYFGL